MGRARGWNRSHRDTAISADKPIISVHIEDIDALHEAYMPFLEHAGIFLPMAIIRGDSKSAVASLRLNDELCLLLKLFDEPEPHCSVFRVVWLSPARQPGGQCAGLGLQFGRNDQSLRSRIESMLEEHKPSGSRWQTL